LLEQGLLRGVVQLETCNRVEFIISADSPEGVRELEDRLPGFSKLVDRDALRHLFKVVSGIDSMVIGEAQIAGQVKSAYYDALERGLTDRELNRVFHRAFFVSKLVRSSTRIGWGSVSVASLGVRLAEQVVGDLSGCRVLLLGAGEMGRLVLQHLLARGAADLVLLNRTVEKAYELARRYPVSVRQMQDLERLLPEADVVISSVTPGSGYILSAGQLSLLQPERTRCVLDLSFPRSVDPRLRELEGVYLYGIEDLRDLSEENRQQREASREEAEGIIEEEVYRFCDEQTHLELSDFEGWIRGEIDREEQRLRRNFVKSGLSAEAIGQSVELVRPALEALARRLIHDRRAQIRERGGRQLKGH
jgi:glutamyl-tRNA reductase